MGTRDSPMYENYIVTFDGLDLENEYFSKSETQFWLDYIKPKMIMFNHLLSKHPMGMSLEEGKLVYDDDLPLELFLVGEIKSLSIDDEGIKAKYVLYEKLPAHIKDKFDFWNEELEEEHQYWLSLVKERHNNGQLGFSSDSMKQLSRREQRGDKTLIKSWPMPYVSLTHIPAEPRNLEHATDYQKSDNSSSDKAKAEFKSITYNGITCQATDRRSASAENKAYERTVRYKGEEKTVSYADPDMPMRRTNDDAREAFLSRHNCSEKKDPFKAGFWSCYDWANPDVKNTNSIKENKMEKKEKEEVKMGMDSDKMGDKEEKMEMPKKDESKNELYDLDTLARKVEMILEMLESKDTKVEDMAEDEEKAAESEDDTQDTYKGLGKSIETILEKVEKMNKPRGASQYSVNTDDGKTFNINVMGGRKDDDETRFVKAIRLMRDKPTGYDKQLKALGLVPASSGGYTTQIQQSNELIDLLLARSVFMRGGEAQRLVDVLPMNSNVMTIPVISSGGDTYWVGENSSITPSAPTFEQRTLIAKKLSMMIPVSNELLADNNVQLERRLRELMVRKMMNAVDKAILFGSGVAVEPLGLRNHAGITKTALNAAPTYTDLLNAIERIRAENVELGPNTAWVINPYIMTELRQIQDPGNNYIWTSGNDVSNVAVGSEPPRLLSYPVVDTTNNSRGVGSNSETESDIYFGDWSNVIVGLRSDVEIRASDTAGDSFQNDQTLIRASMRMDVAVKHPEAIEILTDVQ